MIWLFNSLYLEYILKHKVQTIREGNIEILKDIDTGEELHRFEYKRLRK